ncbi:MAG: ABC transporter substrate-binding protein [Theionarchaea archaeon]|nr:ABC transporter substrate-binding protein [Theionarchaea archaeon]
MKKAVCVVLIACMIHPLQQDTYGGTLKVGYQTPIETLDPHRIHIFYDDFYSSIAAVSQIFEGLVCYEQGSAMIQPSLAESWDISENGLVYTFHLREHVYWQDGNHIFADGESRKVSAHDFVYAWNRVTAPETLSPMGEFFEKTAKIASWRARGNETFEVTLSQPNPGFLYMLPFPCFSVVPREIDEQYGLDMFSAHAVGTGPFELKTWSDTLFLSYNEDYWRGEPYLSGIEYFIYPSDELAAAFSNSFLDVCTIPEPAWDQFDENTVLAVPNLEIVYIGMNCQNPPLTDERVRQALNLAIDPGDAIMTFQGKKVVKAVSLLPPGMICSRYPTQEDRYARDVEKARELLEEAGYTSNPRFTLHFLSFESYVQQQCNEIYTEQLKDIDVDVEVEYVDFGSLLNRVDSGEPQLFTLGWYVDWPYPDQFLLLFHSANWGPGGNSSFYMNKEVDSLIKTAGTTSDREEACRLYERIESLVMDDAPWILQWHPTTGYAVQEWINGFEPGGMGDCYLQLHSVWISSHHRQTTRIPPEPSSSSSSTSFYVMGGVIGILCLVIVLLRWKK